ncbi:MAG: ribbon-helix-helix protein, CopG family [Acidobacteria bacterium]|nr:ribbon-helix-helix protein, CopG family [Acidobacteriota bacterium]
MSDARRAVDADGRLLGTIAGATRRRSSEAFVRASFVLPPEVDAELRAEALRRDMSSSAIVREALREHFARRR